MSLSTGTTSAATPKWKSALAKDLPSALGAGLGAVFGMGSQSPMSAANPFFNQISNELPGYFEPYMQHGEEAYGHLGDVQKLLQSQYGQLMSDPGGFLNKLGAGYKASPGYQYNVDQATMGANHAAAAGGMVGSPAEQQALAGRISGMASQDYNNYLGHIMGLYGQGLSGERGEEGIYGGLYNTGANASMGLGEDLSSALASQAKIAAAQAQANQKEASQAGSGAGALIGDVAAGLLLM